MLTILPSKAPMTVAVEFVGKATEEDAQKLDEYVQQHFPGETKFNLLAIVGDVDGSTVKGVLEGMKLDVKRMNQLNKVAIVSDKDWLKAVAPIGNIVPGIEAKQFDKDEAGQAWNWILQQ